MRWVLFITFLAVSPRPDLDVQHVVQGYLVCQGADGYRSTEWSRDRMRFGQDSDGDRWSTSRWQGPETTTVWPRQER